MLSSFCTRTLAACFLHFATSTTIASDQNNIITPTEFQSFVKTNNLKLIFKGSSHDDETFEQDISIVANSDTKNWFALLHHNNKILEIINQGSGYTDIDESLFLKTSDDVKNCDKDNIFLDKESLYTLFRGFDTNGDLVIIAKESNEKLYNKPLNGVILMTPYDDGFHYQGGETFLFKVSKDQCNYNILEQTHKPHYIFL